MNPKTIFYGAGEHAEWHLGRWLAEGFSPVCFADRDEKKHHASLGGLEILPLEMAIARYPDYILYVTLNPKNILDVTDFLIGFGIPRERIRYFEPYEWRVGCSAGQRQSIEGENIHLCCHAPRKSKGFFTFPFKNKKDFFDIYEKKSNELLESWKSGGGGGPCDGCPYLKEGLYPSKINPVRVLSFASGFAHEACNLKCVYCTHRENFNPDSKISLYETMKGMLSFFDESDLPIIALCTGEFFIRNDCDKILRYLLCKKCDVGIVTNCTIYNEVFAEICRAGKGKYITVSPDCGTGATYKKIKGTDFFAAVATNLEKYSDAGVKKINLKYIFLPGINDNKADVKGFMDIAKKVHAHVHISSLRDKTRERLPEKTLDSVSLLYETAVEFNLSATFVRTFFHPEDFAFLGKRHGDFSKQR